MATATRKGTFQKGDPRINRKGRPKTFDALRALALKIGHEIARDENGETILIDGKPVTSVEVILRQWAMSNVPALQMKFIEVAYGKVPEPVTVVGAGEAIPIAIVKMPVDEL